MMSLDHMNNKQLRHFWGDTCQSLDNPRVAVGSLPVMRIPESAMLYAPHPRTTILPTAEPPTTC
jgi:hypothetical protein